jgi:hypothetical protein
MNRVKNARCSCNEAFWCHHIISTLLVFSLPHKNMALHLDFWKENIQKMEKNQLEDLIFNMISINPRMISNLTDGFNIPSKKKNLYLLIFFFYFFTFNFSQI